MGRTPTRFPRGGRLLRHNQERQLNSEGLLEYDLVFNQPAGYAGFNLQRVTAKLKEKSPPAGVKGVRVFGEYNHYDGLLPEPKKKKSLLPSFRRHKEAGAVTSGSPAP
jgi:hypothetical protein